MNSSQGTNSSAFNRLELLASVAAVGVLITIIGPVLANSNTRSDRVACLNNLRQIGVGYTHFMLEHNDLPPWWVSTRDGGTQDYFGGIPGLPDRHRSFVQFSVLSNSLESPRHLGDPGDRRLSLTSAQFWSTNEFGGLYHVRYRNNSISYFIGLDGPFRSPTGILAGDRHVWTEGNATTCSSGIAPCSVFSSGGGTFSYVRWTNDVHGVNQGNVLLIDGSVQQTTSRQLRDFLIRGDDIAGSTGGGNVHALFPH